MTSTEPQFSLFASTRRSTMADSLEAATEVAHASAQTYLAGVYAIVEQQRLAHQASLEWICEVTGVQSMMPLLRDHQSPVGAGSRVDRAGRQV